MNKFTQTKRDRLEGFLKHKLDGLPKHFLELTLGDIVNQTPAAKHVPSTPPDIQLPYFLTNRARLQRNGNSAIKNPTEQSLDLTRAVFFYRLDEAHQFQRYHDSQRWNITVFISLLAIDMRPHPEVTDPTSKFQLTTAAKDFMTSFLQGVIEHHNNPTVFDKREEFIKLWKKEPFDFFVFRASQKRYIKSLLRKTGPRLEAELDKRRAEMGEERYQREVAPFVNVIVNGKLSQGIPRDYNGRIVGHSVEVQGQEQVTEGHDLGDEEGEVNELLDALQVPFDKEEGGGDHTDTRTAVEKRKGLVCDDSAAIDAMKECSEAEMVEAMRVLFFT